MQKAQIGDRYIVMYFHCEYLKDHEIATVVFVFCKLGKCTLYKSYECFHTNKYTFSSIKVTAILATSIISVV